jgi:hypothetical protein
LVWRGAPRLSVRFEVLDVDGEAELVVHAVGARVVVARRDEAEVEAPFGQRAGAQRVGDG